MSNPSDDFRSRPPGVGPEDDAVVEHVALSHEDEAVLARAREQLGAGRAPADARQRLLARAIEETTRPSASPVPARELVTVPQRGARSVWIGGALAVAVLALSVTRGLSRGSEADLERETSAARRGGAQLLDAPIFRAPAREAADSELTLMGPNLLGKAPFSPGSGAWQVRRWDDLKADPGERVPVEHEAGALCVALGGGQRVIGAWPWLDAASIAAPSDPAPPRVTLVGGRAYRLAFRAWARAPLPAQMLIAVGHAGAPFSAAGAARVALTEEPQGYVVDFVAPGDDRSVGVAFLVSTGDGDATRLCLSDVALGERASR